PALVKSIERRTPNRFALSLGTISPELSEVVTCALGTARSPRGRGLSTESSGGSTGKTNCPGGLRCDFARLGSGHGGANDRRPRFARRHDNNSGQPKREYESWRTCRWSGHRSARLPNAMIMVFICAKRRPVSNTRNCLGLLIGTQ